MEEKEVRISILGVIDEDKLENHENMHLFKTYAHGAGIYLIKKADVRIALREVYKSNNKDKNGNDFACWNEFVIPISVAIEDIKKEQETQLKELKETVEHLNDELYDKIVKIETTVTNSNNAVSFLCDSLNSLQDDSHVIERLQSIEETLKQLTEAHAQLTENGSTSGSGITEKTLLEALAIVTKKV